jgi:flagellar hook protein FlgE
MAIISDNISNVNTVGFKAAESRFSTLVTSGATSTSFSPGGVQARPQALVDQQGLLQSSASPLDIAISGAGFFAVNSLADATGEALFTRAGQFSQDELGNLVNTAGFFLQGWPLDANGLLPGAPGNVTNTTSNADISSLEAVNVNNINGVAAATTTVALGANLQATEPTFTGATDTSLTLGITAATDLGTTPGLTNGDQFSVVSGTASVTLEYQATPTLATHFSTLTELVTAVNAVTGLSASISGSAADATVTITGGDPRDTLVLTEVSGTPAVDLFGGASPITTADTYDETDATKNMASGTVSPDFSRAVRIFDAQGTGHDLQVGFLKVSNNNWAVEVFASPASDVSVTAPLVNGQVATGTLVFNGDGTLNSVSAGLANPVTINWTTGASASTVTYDWGTAGALGTGLADGLTQFDGNFNVAFVNQNGSEVGQLNGVTIDDQGFVIASFTNGETTKLFKLPIVTFADPNSLEARNGNVFSQSDASGEFNLREANQGGAGLVAPAALEAANVDLGQEFTDMIITQRAFTASSRVISTVDELLEDLIRI